MDSYVIGQMVGYIGMGLALYYMVVRRFKR
jgi:hypothetical protein